MYWSVSLLLSSLHMSLSAQGQTMVSALVFSTLLWLSLILALRFCLKLLLSYHRWMFEQHGRVSNFTKVWVVSRDFCIVSQLPLVVALQSSLFWKTDMGSQYLMERLWIKAVLICKCIFPVHFCQTLLGLLSSRKPLLYSYQTSLPHLPVPAIKDTLSRVIWILCKLKNKIVNRFWICLMLCFLSQYLRSVRPLLNDLEYKRMSKLASDFEKNLGNRLQRYLKLKAMWATNYVSSLINWY